MSVRYVIVTIFVLVLAGCGSAEKKSKPAKAKKAEKTVEPSPSPSPEPENPEAKKRMAEVRKTVLKNGRTIKSCYQSAIQKNPELAGTVHMRWRIGADGKVKNVVTTTNTLNSPEVETCIMRQIMGWQFTRADFDLDVTYPFVFKKKE